MVKILNKFMFISTAANPQPVIQKTPVFPDPRYIDPSRSKVPVFSCWAGFWTFWWVLNTMSVLRSYDVSWFQNIWKSVRECFNIQSLLHISLNITYFIRHKQCSTWPSYLSDRFLMLSWKCLHITTVWSRTSSLISTSSKNLCATNSNASSGQACQ